MAAVLSLDDLSPERHYVVECSSFQIDLAPSLDAARKQIELLTRSLSDLRRERDSLRGQLVAARARQAQTERQLEERDQRLARATGAMSELQQRLAAADQRQAWLEREVARLGTPPAPSPEPPAMPEPWSANLDGSVFAQLSNLAVGPGGEQEHERDVLRVLRAIGLVEELRLDRFSMELERLDLGITALDPLELHGDEVLAPQWQWSRHSWLVGLGRRGALRVEPLDPPPIPSVEKIADPSGLTSGEALLNGASANAVGPDWPWQAAGASTRAELPIGGLVRFVKVRRLWPVGDTLQPAVLVGVDEAGDTLLLLYSFGPGGKVILRSQAYCGGAGAEPIGYDLHLDSDSDGSPDSARKATGLRETVLLRVPGLGERSRPTVIAVDAPNGVLRLRAHVLPAELLVVASNAAGSLHVTSARATLRRPGQKPLSVPAPTGAVCAALSDSGELLAIGTSTGQVQILMVEGESLRLTGQHLFAKGIAALCFLPEGSFGVPCLAIGTEDEQIHVVAADFKRDGQELVRLAAGGTPQRMLCRPLSDGGYRLLVLLQGGVLTSWEAHPQDGHLQTIDRLLELAARAAGSRANVLRAALRGQGPHIRAVALREILRSAREGRIAGSILTNSGVGSRRYASW